MFIKKDPDICVWENKKVDESTYAHTSLLYHKITKKSITIQAIFVSLSRSKVLSSLALVAHFRVELCQIRGPINKSRESGFFNFGRFGMLVIKKDCKIIRKELNIIDVL